jgi:hypothetical protein
MMIEVTSLELLLEDVRNILKKHSSDLKVATQYFGSKAKQEKPAFHLYGIKEISLFGKSPQSTYVGGVIQQNNYVSFYLSPIYSHPELIKNISPELKQTLKGKSCFNIKNSSPELLKEIEKILLLGIQKYKEIDWI